MLLSAWLSLITSTIHMDSYCGHVHSICMHVCVRSSVLCAIIHIPSQECQKSKMGEGKISLTLNFEYWKKKEIRWKVPWNKNEIWICSFFDKTYLLSLCPVEELTRIGRVSSICQHTHTHKDFSQDFYTKVLFEVGILIWSVNSRISFFPFPQRRLIPFLSFRTRRLGNLYNRFLCATY